MNFIEHSSLSKALVLMHCVFLCLGEEHSTYGGKPIPERVQAVIQCRCQCYRIMTEAEKAGILNAFNPLKDHEAQSIYLRGCISVTSDEMIRRRILESDGVLNTRLLWHENRLMFAKKPLWVCMVLRHHA